jgi:hypothetical protein
MAADLSPTALRKSRLAAEVQLLAQRYGEVAFDRSDGAWVYVANLPLPPGWSQKEVEILIDIPYGNPGYPRVAPQWFWTASDLRTSAGKSIVHFFTQAGAHADRDYLEKGWGHFCIHLSDWRPASGRNLRQGHSLVSYLDLISTVFRDHGTLHGS